MTSPKLPLIVSAEIALKDIESLHGRNGPTIKLRGCLEKINDVLNAAHVETMGAAYWQGVFTSEMLDD